MLSAMVKVTEMQKCRKAMQVATVSRNVFSVPLFNPFLFEDLRDDLSLHNKYLKSIDRP